MSKCRNCLSEEICRYNDGHNLYCKDDYVCPHFKNRSEWVHLPCKVGDTVFKLWYEPCHNGETHPDSYDCEGCLDECDIKKTITEYKVPSLRFIVNELMNDSCIYYLTREEAERALEEKI